jgi:hypothetical protein
METILFRYFHEVMILSRESQCETLNSVIILIQVAKV